MLQSGVSLLRSLQVLREQTTNEAMKAVIDSLGKEIQKGNSFSKALSFHPKVFDRLFVVTAEIGQESGQLPKVLAQLSEYLEKVVALKRKFRQAMTYPIFVVGVAFVAVGFLLLFIVPAFAEMFKRMQIELPALTKIVLSMSDDLKQYGLPVLVIIIVLVLVFKSTLKKEQLREKIEAKLFSVPLIGDLLMKNHVARFCRTLGTLLQADVSLIEALGVTMRIFSSEQLQQEIQGVINGVKQGRTIAEPLVTSKFFPPMVSQMIAVGEETSELDVMLLKVAAYYEKDIDVKVDTLSSVMEPIIILFLGVVVAGILISMYMPMFEVMSSVGMGG
jgi:type IV pilus assembly protein PilC